MIKLIYGVGVNDADYPVTPKVGGKAVWCPFYRKWNAMLRRSYGEKHKKEYPSYNNCLVVDEWHLFSNFRSWMYDQDWVGLELDKDLLFPGNRVYSPETCIFVSHKVNNFILESDSARGKLPIGVVLRGSKYEAKCKDNGVEIYLGRFDSPESAHDAWLACKQKLAYKLASEQKDNRVAEALINRYKNYKTP